MHVEQSPLSLALAGDERAIRSLVARLAPVIHARVATAGATQDVFAALFADDARELRAWDPAGASLEDFVSRVAERHALPAAHASPASPLDDGARLQIVRTIVATYPPARARKTRFRGPAFTVALALTAAVLLFVAVRPRPAPVVPAVDPATIAALPDYAISVQGGPEPAALVVRKGDTFAAIARPSATVQGPVTARAYLVRDNDVVDFAGKIDVASDGPVRVGGTLTDFPGVSAGSWSLLVIVGRPEAMRGAFAEASQPARGRAVLRTPMTVE